MIKKSLIFFAAVAVLFSLSTVSSARAEKDAVIKSQTCFACHPVMEGLWNKGMHKTAKIEGTQCHSGLEAHIASNPPGIIKPVTNINPSNCGGCHRDQFDTFFTVDYTEPARLEKSLLTERAPNPLWDKLMMGHGFTKEHNAPRGHAYMLLDHLVVDRAYGGRFQPKVGWQYVVAPTPVSLWDVLEDRYPESKEHKAFIHESAPAANPTCLQCKTTDNILKWKHLGEKDPAAKWDRTSNVVELVKDIQNPVGCIHFHDPHATGPRIVRDALIQALTRPEADTLWHKDDKRTKIEVMDFRNFRKTALLNKYDTKRQCGQCHVEYNCNPGVSPKTGEKIGFSDLRTNHFPMKDVFQIYDHYNQADFRDFRHTLTGGLLFKAQHPEVEVFWNSKHDKAGVSCNDCHMPKIKNKAGKVFTSHWQTSPKKYIKETCLKCHKEWTEEKAVYTIDSVKNHVKGKMRKAEFWLDQLIDKIAAAKKSGIDEALIKEAQEQHQKAHILWEWWTAENSDGFHNPDQARESLTLSVVESKKGIELLTKAISEKK